MLKLIGGILSIIYAAVLLVVIFCTNILNKSEQLTLNELGDFLAGAFSPLAFLWLVIGYLTQGKELKLNRQMLTLQAKELKNNNEALLLQAKELENAVQAQNAMVEQSKVQIEIEKAKLDEEKEKERIRNSPPDLEVTFEKIENTNQYTCYVQNTGGPVVDLFILVLYNEINFKLGNTPGRKIIGANPWTESLKLLTAEQQKKAIFTSSDNFEIKTGATLIVKVKYKEKLTDISKNNHIEFKINEDLTISQTELIEHS